ncbi:helix-turn-helix domain-containing protein, partial [Streptococcus agalactiae]|nr:helix-turn-helix domain-containing protein [Streptococcus agalactiae]
MKKLTNFPQKLKELRKEKKLTQTELESKLNISQKSY